MSVKVTALTGDNIQALLEAQKRGWLPAGTAITKTTATFPVTALEALRAIDGAKVGFNVHFHDTRNTQSRSLAAVRRKLLAQQSQ